MTYMYTDFVIVTLVAHPEILALEHISFLLNKMHKGTTF